MLSIIYYTETGNTEAMAEAIKDGAEEAGKEVRLLAVDDASEADVKDADAVLFGCPAKGDEEIEDLEFRPFLESVMDDLKDKKVGIFGSYAWNDGEWIENWQKEMEENGVEIVEALKAFDYPDADALKECKELGKNF